MYLTSVRDVLLVDKRVACGGALKFSVWGQSFWVMYLTSVRDVLLVDTRAACVGAIEISV